MSLAKALLLFGIAGPLIGLAGVLAQDPSMALGVLPVLLVSFAYVLGAVPAIVTGLAAWALRGKVGRYSGGLLCGGMGALTAAVFWLLLRLPLTRGLVEWESVLRLCVIPGALAGSLCGLIFFWSRADFFKSNRPANRLA